MVNGGAMSTTGNIYRRGIYRCRRFLLVAILSSSIGCGQPGGVGQAGPSPPTTGLPSTTATPAASESPSAAPSGWSTFADSRGRFSFQYPTGWRTEVPQEGEESYPVSVWNFYSDGRILPGWGAKILLKVSLFENREGVNRAPFPSPRQTTLGGSSAEYEIWYRSDTNKPSTIESAFADEPDLEAFARARSVRERVTYLIALHLLTRGSSTEEPIAMFWHVVNGFQAIE